MKKKLISVAIVLAAFSSCEKERIQAPSTAPLQVSFEKDYSYECRMIMQENDSLSDSLFERIRATAADLRGLTKNKKSIEALPASYPIKWRNNPPE